MEDKTPELVGKKKLVVDNDAFFSAPRKENNELTDGLQDVINHAAYFSSAADKVRVVLGKNWDYRERDLAGPKVFSNDWPAPKVFEADYLWLEPCGDASEEGTGLTQKREEKFMLKHDHAMTDSDVAYPVMHLASWTMYTKTGITDVATSKIYEPIIRTNKTFFDHYHESINPFTPADLDSMQPTGKAFFANYKTYYNERLDSSNFESATGNLKLEGSGSPYIQNALPSIYAFLRLFVNKNLAENSLFDLETLTSYDLKSGQLEDIYKTVLKNFTLEALLTLYGWLGDLPDYSTLGKTKIIEKIVSTSFDNIDADSLFSDYFNEYAKILTTGEGRIITENALSLPTHQYQNRMRALERMMTNLVFSPNTIKLLNKVDQYKKHFPFYAELEFTANLDTELGDAMKKMYLTKFMSEVVLGSTKPPESDRWHDSWAAGYQSGQNPDLPNVYPAQQPNFFNYTQEEVYSDLGGQQVEVEEDSLLSGPKKVIDVTTLVSHWTTTFAEFNGVYVEEQGTASSADFSTGDLRNYTTFFRNDYSEPTNLDSDENVIFKKLFGSAFLAKILDIYNNNKRTYQEIIDGKPAYTEDLFYRIEKTRKIAGSEEEEVVQNILIPNTSELDIAKYVDTQLKYATYATYKYNVYAHRAVFGSKYEYQWLNTNGVPVAAPGKRSLQTTTFPAEDNGDPLGPQVGISESLSNGFKKYYATFNTVVEPSIVLLEDKIFSTPEILILDKPPVIPDINIVPYRAVNNRIKILITGASDRYRAKPVIMVQSDIEEFDKIKRAQLVVDNSGNPLEDGKVEFGSDDPVRTFQIFRTEQKPKTYQDFAPYQQINREFFEEHILPNTKYYYTFRAIDDHGHVSNPTPVYEVELIDEKGAVKPIIRLVDMTPPKNKTNTKACQKYIYVKPTLQQLYFSDDSDVDSIFSQQAKKKRYKMRLTSKGSGKKIDINFSFTKESKN